MGLARLLRELVDERVRPGQRGSATLGAAAQAAALGRGTRCGFLSRPSDGGVVTAGLYGRAKYGREVYGRRAQ